MRAERMRGGRSLRFGVGVVGRLGGIHGGRRGEEGFGFLFVVVVVSFELVGVGQSDFRGKGEGVSEELGRQASVALTIDLVPDLWRKRNCQFPSAIRLNKSSSPHTKHS